MFRNLMLWWLTTGVYCVENENGQHASGHPNTGPWCWPGLCFAVFYFALNICGPWWYSERRCEKIADRSNVYFNSSLNVSGYGSTGCKHLWPKGDMSIVGCRKGNHVCSVFFFFFFFALLHVTTKHFSWFTPSGLSHVWCCAAVCRDNCFLAVFTICDCFVAGALWEPLIIDVPLQCHQPLHDFPPVVDSKVFRTFCKTCL